MKTAITIGLTCLLHASADADFWSNGSLVTHEGIGAGGADISAIVADPLSRSFGLNVNANGNTPGPFWVGDNVTPSRDWHIVNVKVYAYEVLLATPSINEAYLAIWRGNPRSGGALIFGELPSTIRVNRFGGVQHQVTESGRALYRTANDTRTVSNTHRRVSEVTIDIGSGLYLEAGQEYTFMWSLGSALGVGNPPVAVPLLSRRGDALHYFEGEGLYRNALAAADNENSQVDIPFGVTIVPEPGSFLIVSVGVLALRARKRSSA